MFLWSFVAHMALPIGEAGIRDIPNGQALFAQMSATLGPAAGLYLFPGVKGASFDENAKAMAANPSGLLVYRPAGSPFNFPAMLGIELLTQIIEALIAAFLLAQTRIASFAGRVGFIALAGVLAAITTNAEYWNWYSFPGLYISAYAGMQLAGYAVAGLIAAWLVRPN